MVKKIIIYSDGGARGNPGHAGIGAVLYTPEKLEKIASLKKYIGHGTNNQAEYLALLMGIEKAKELQAEEVDCYLDSELVVKQLKREYKVKNPELAKIFVKIWNLTLEFKKITFTHVPRAENKEADSLVNQAIDEHLEK